MLLILNLANLLVALFLFFWLIKLTYQLVQLKRSGSNSITLAMAFLFGSLAVLMFNFIVLFIHAQIEHWSGNDYISSSVAVLVALSLLLGSTVYLDYKLRHDEEE